MIPLCAVNKKTREYVYPKHANKKDEYCCPECNKDLIFHQGNIRIHHFVHKFTKSDPCNYYNHPTESQIHKNAKILLKILLDKKEKISFIRKCCCCKKDEEFEIPEISETSNIQLEYRFEYDGLKIADVAYIDNNEIICIFEICYTHKTQSEKRPEPWFEIDALSFIHNANNLNNSSLQINCLRHEKCDDCIEFEKEQIEKKKKATDILYDWFKSGIEIPPFTHTLSVFGGVHKNAKCERFDDVFDLIIETGVSGDKYQRYCVRLVYNSDIYFSKESEIIRNCLGLYFIDIDWVLSQCKPPEKISYIASLDYYREYDGLECFECQSTDGFYVKRINVNKTDYIVTSCGCLFCGFNKDSKYIFCPLCKQKNTPFCVAETNINKNICKSCDIEIFSSRGDKFLLSVPFSGKDRAKKLGAMWDNSLKRWFINANHPNVVSVLLKYKNFLNKNV